MIIFDKTAMQFHQKIIKRAFDIIVSFLGLTVLFIPFIVVGLCIKLYDHGPIFFKQKRIGRNGKPFTVIKFRTMGPDAEKSGSVTTSNDTRITPTGRFLRKYKIDEFPQLFNVLIGKMSFVGPRPDVAGYADRLQGNSRDILNLRPGITGPASLYFRNEEKLLAQVENPREYNDTVIWPKKVQINLEYHKNWSFWKDIGYILITLFHSLGVILRLMPMHGEKIVEK